MKSGLLLLTLCSAVLGAELPRVSVYATAGDIGRYLQTEDGRVKAAAAMKGLGVSRVILEGRRGDEYVDPATMRAVRDWMTGQGFAVAGGIATVPGKSFGVRQNESLGWLNWQAAKTQADVAGFFRENAPLFDELIVDDFYCTADTSAESERARGNRSWGEYRRDLLTGLIEPMMIRPAREANPKVRLTLKYPQWYDRFEKFGYDPPRMSPKFDRIWVGTEVRNPETQRMGFAQPTMGYMNFRWLRSVSGEKVEGAWFDHIECTAQNFVDQAYESVLAGARELTLFHLGDVVEGHPGHALFRKALPELKRLAARVKRRQVRGVAYYKPAGSNADGNLWLMDYLGMLGIPIVPAAEYPFQSRVVILGVQAAADSSVAEKAARHRKQGGKIFVTPAFARRAPGHWTVLDVKTFTEQDYKDTGEWLLPPKKLAWMEKTREEADAFRKPLLDGLGLQFSAPARVALIDFGGEYCVSNFRNEAVEVVLNGKKLGLPAHAVRWVGR
ncbi:MAG: hypothetical protein LC126_08710 [Bryobacterales bacterium]|nr:hypothetical protein [Bryobacterales bacterium]